MSDEQTAEQTTVYLGNRNTIAVEGGERVPYPGNRCTTVRVRADATLMEAIQEITSPNGVWPAHSDATAPAWVAAEGPLAGGITTLLASHYGCEVREPNPEA